jgi:hypothetical protein
MRLVPAIALVLSACSPLPGLDAPPPTGPPASAPAPASTPATSAARCPPTAAQAADDAPADAPTAVPAPPPRPAPEPGRAAAADPDTDRICQQTECRPATKLTLHLDDGRTIDVPAPRLPYVYGEVIRALPGDDFYVAADERGGRLLNLRYVRPPASPKDVLHIQLRHEELKGGHWHMLATVTSHFSQTLAYRAATQIPGRPPRRTSVCPLHPGMPVFEQWLSTFVLLHLQDFRIVDPKSEDGRVCK